MYVGKVADETKGFTYTTSVSRGCGRLRFEEDGNIARFIQGQKIGIDDSTAFLSNELTNKAKLSMVLSSMDCLRGSCA